MSVIKGIIANKGFIEGKVKLVKNPGEYLEDEEEVIIVTEYTTPQMTISLMNAKAVITTKGGLTCHAAIVSRELGIPCLVGVEKAFELLNEGDKIQVNANEGYIKKL